MEIVFDVDWPTDPKDSLNLYCCVWRSFACVGSLCEVEWVHVDVVWWNQIVTLSFVFKIHQPLKLKVNKRSIQLSHVWN